jgi:hypothetical protein
VEAGEDLVADDEGAGASAQPLQLAVEVNRRRVPAASALHRFDEHGSGLARCERCLELADDLVLGDIREEGQPTEGVDEREISVDSRDVLRCYRLPVVVVAEADDSRALRLVAGDPHRSLGGFHPRAVEAVERQVFVDVPCEGFLASILHVHYRGPRAADATELVDDTTIDRLVRMSEETAPVLEMSSMNTSPLVVKRRSFRPDVTRRGSTEPP